MRRRHADHQASRRRRPTRRRPAVVAVLAVVAAALVTQLPGHDHIGRLIGGDGTAATITLDDADTTVVTGQDAAGPGGSTGGNGGGDLHASTGTRSYTTPAGVLVAQHDTTSGWRWLTTDTQGSVVDAVAADGTTTHTRYYPYGQPTTTGPPDGTVGTGYLGRFHTGIDTDTTTGAVPGNPNAGVAAAPGDTLTTPTRDYATSLGRFTTPDPLFNLTDPQSLNPYSYADDNPIANTDPDGNYFRSDNDTAPWWVSDIILADGDTSQQAVAKTEADLQHDQSEMEPLALHYSVHPVTWGSFLGGVYDMTLGVVAGTVEGAADSAITFSPLALLAPGLASELRHGVDSVIATGVTAVGGNTHSRAYSTGQFLALAGAIIAAGAGAGADAAAAESTAADTTAGSASAAEDVPLASGKLFVNGSKSANNLTPRLTDTDGLSSFDTLEAGVKQGGKGQCFDVACLREGGLGAFKTGPPGHYSIRPLEPGGMDAWLASRAAGTEAESPFTQFLQSIAETVWNR